MRTQLLLSIGLAALCAACGKPAAVQPEPQNAATAPVAAPDAMATAPMQVDPVTGAPMPGTAMTGASDIPVDRSTPEQRAAAQAAADKAGLPMTNESRGTWACDNGETIELRFFPDQGIAVLVRGGENTELQREQVASGIKYSNGQTIIQGKGDTLMLNVGMMATATCKAVIG
jgi:membrane-bound inhibitor of C-type lysozyme